MTASQRLAALRAEGLTVVEHEGWRTHDRNHKGPWGPVHGAMIHHTAGTAPGDADVVWSGRADLPGPCAHDYLSPQGVITMMSAGRANHAGGGSPAVLEAVKNENYGDRPPAPTHHDGDDGAADGNRSFYGLEASNAGGKGDAWPAVQYDAAVRWAAAHLRFHGWTAKSTIGHKEWSDWKPDPRFDMVQFRKDVAERLRHPASWSPGDESEQPPTKPPAPPARPVVDLSRLIDAARQDPPKAGTPVSYAGVKTVEAALVAEGLLDRSLADGHYGTATRTAYAKWQRRYSEANRLGWTSADCDGIPGRASLVALGARRGFTVTS
ncbi:N-acetylmuramoyl-L-alanine amidase [Streptomyces sp. NPDC101132]|uniref:N-acetylmuramoyl-L-alanine amidase n=1 Tax=Streptomyces sp. NPDC101132 TaxID=3366110 RepID=UPI003808CE4C